MKVLNIGSLNLDRVYSVADFVRGGETVAALGLESFLGGKGHNQSLALARAGAEVYHAGMIGADGHALAESLRGAGANVRFVRETDCPSGHAIIQLTPRGGNCIIVCGAANHRVNEALVDEALAAFGPGDMLLLQNETTCVAHAMRQAKARGMLVALNPSPLDDALLACPLELVDLWLLNEHEGAGLTGTAAENANAIAEALQNKFPHAEFVLTLGRDGVLYRKGSTTLTHGIYDVPVVDTTGAGDTFCGYFIACHQKGMDAAGALEYASLASSWAVGRRGAGPSIPTWEQVEEFRAQIQVIV